MVLSLATMAEEDDYLARMHASFDRIEQLLVAFVKSRGLPIPTFPVQPSTSGSNSAAKKEKVMAMFDTDVSSSDRKENAGLEPMIIGHNSSSATTQQLTMADPIVELPIYADIYTMKEISDPIAHIPSSPLISTKGSSSTKTSSTAIDMDLLIESPSSEQKETEQCKTPPITDNNDISIGGGETDMVLGDSNPLKIDETIRPKHEGPAYDTVKRPLNVAHQVFDIQPHNLEAMSKLKMMEKMDNMGITWKLFTEIPKTKA